MIFSLDSSQITSPASVDGIDIIYYHLDRNEFVVGLYYRQFYCACLLFW